MNTRSQPALDITELLATSRIGALQLRVFLLCLLCLLMDGFDVQAMGFVAPAVIADWGVERAALGRIFAAGNIGVLIGALLFGMVADRFGRRPVLIGATLFFALVTIATAFARNLDQLLWLRLIAGIGMGSVIPNATALVGEYSPLRRRVALMMCVTVGFTAGAAIGGFVAAWLIPAFGWRSVFLFGGIVPLLIALAMLVGLPESLQFLALDPARRERLLRGLRALDPALRVDATTVVVVREPGRSEGVPFVQLLREGRAPVTLLLWLVMFLNLLVTYSLASWLPTLVTGMGYATRTAVLVGSLLPVGGVIGTLALAALSARHPITTLLAVTFAAAAASIAVIGHAGIPLALLCALVVVAGAGVLGAQPGLVALAGDYYPTPLRATGAGWALGIGRIGAIVGPYIGGILLGLDWGNRELFHAVAVPAALAMLTTLALGVCLRR